MVWRFGQSISLEDRDINNLKTKGGELVVSTFQDSSKVVNPLCKGCRFREYAEKMNISNHDCDNCREGYWKEVRKIYKSNISQRIYDSIGFLNVMIEIAEGHAVDKAVEIPADNLRILRELLKDIKQEMKRDDA